MKALSKFVMQKLCVSIVWTNLLALKEVVIMKNDCNCSHSLSFVLTVLVPNNPAGYSFACQVQLQFMQ